MPRLVGRQSNTGSYIVVAFLLGLLLGAGGVSEYFGITHLTPTFGRERSYMRKEGNTTGKLIAASDIGEPIEPGRKRYA